MPNQPSTLPPAARSGRRSIVDRLRLAIVAAAVAWLPGCATQATRSVPEWQAAELKQHLSTLLCRLPTPCRYFSLRLSTLDRPVAEIDFARRIIISRGMLQLMRDEAELMFVLAHEVAHYELAHRAPRDAAKRLPLELAADQRAAQAICALGLRGSAGRTLLERINRPDQEVLDSALRELALAEVQARLDALGDCGPGTSAHLILDGRSFRTLIRTAVSATNAAADPAAAGAEREP